MSISISSASNPFKNSLISLSIFDGKVLTVNNEEISVPGVREGARVR